jgi:glycogen phosphorylase
MTGAAILDTHLMPPPKGLAPAELAEAVRHHLAYGQGKSAETATRRELYQAVAWVVRDRVSDRWRATQEAHRGARAVSYLSMEFLLGRLLRSTILALDLEAPLQEALDGFGASIEQMEEEERPAGLGSGGLGRLAACYLDSLACQDLPAWGYGLRYRFGLFRQRFDEEGWQQETPDDWLRWGCPWEVVHPDLAVTVRFYGHVSSDYQWHDTWDVVAVPHDIPVPGYRTGTVNTLRLWSSEPSECSLDLARFQAGDHREAHVPGIDAHALVAVLYPGEHTPQGRELRLKQQYLLASATLQDLVRRHEREGGTLSDLHERVVLQLNDTHPAIAIPELMRIVLDRGHTWEEAWGTVNRVFAYTNHTLLPEALETWPMSLVDRVLPRHAQIVREIDLRFGYTVQETFPGDEARAARMAIVGGAGEPRLRMANLSSAASFSINGVAAIHTDLLQRFVLADFHAMFPERFNNKTNGVTPRRWVLQANPRLSALISERIGEDWIRDLDLLAGLEPLADDAEFRARWREVKQANKADLAHYVASTQGVQIDPSSLFDAQIKRIHEYKRQLLLTLHTIDRYLRIKAGEQLQPRVVIFAGKAASDYHAAKRILRLIHGVADVVNADPDLNGQLKVVFLPDYKVSLAQRIVSAADLSEQISTAGYEASGTGNMKFALNGALTIGTLDGANVEIRDAVGPDNVFIFGLQDHEVRAVRAEGYEPRLRYEEDPRLRAVIDAIADGLFSPADDVSLFQPIVDDLLERDGYLLLADFGSYGAAQERTDATFQRAEDWTRMAILNVARMGRFSSDRSVQDYAREIWNLDPRHVPA